MIGGRQPPACRVAGRVVAFLKVGALELPVTSRQAFYCYGHGSSVRRASTEEIGQGGYQAQGGSARGGRGGERLPVLSTSGDGGFTTREHTFPESLGNTELVLPPGVVCDRCNNGQLSVLDQTICDFLPVKLRRTTLGIASKAGKIPVFTSANATAEHIPGVDGADPTLVLTAKNPRGALREVDRYPDGRVRMNWSGSGGRRMTPRYASELSRALLKIALECAWIDHGEIMLESRFDHIREGVLGEPRDGYFLVANQGNPNETKGTLSYDFQRCDEDTWRMWVGTDLFGVYMQTDSRLSKPPGELHEELVSVVTFPADLSAA